MTRDIILILKVSFILVYIKMFLQVLYIIHTCLNLFVFLEYAPKLNILMKGILLFLLKPQQWLSD